MEIDLNTRLIDLTLGDLLTFLNNRDKENFSSPIQNKAPERKIVYGLAGIAKVIGASKTTVWKMKKAGYFDGYIFQIGKSIAAYEDDIISCGKRMQVLTRKEDLKAIKKPRRIR
jgi:hypothetical protein